MSDRAFSMVMADLKASVWYSNAAAILCCRVVAMETAHVAPRMKHVVCVRSLPEAGERGREKENGGAEKESK